ncbi:Protein SHQ1 -like protein [Toxocara canis]|uniref:Protein SHQ1 homolog n=1 Tax=Toxocara canis TaxID=6265 RepID=A0A0B2V4R6_TOXCA|nr:Protein SHQ1 -like protein [Toxocara canis]
MITPLFSIKQDDDFLIVDIRAPYANVKDTEIEYDGRMFLFSSSPYFLRLHLTADVVQNDNSTAEYDADKGTFMIKVPKKTKGEHFTNLDMITELLRPQKKPTAERPVEEVNGDADEENEDDYYIEQKESVAEEEPRDELCAQYGYGFGWSRHGVLGRLESEIDCVVDLEDADNSNIDQRRAACCAHDQLSFQPDHYIADLMEKNEQLEECLRFEFSTLSFEISLEDREHLKELPKRKLPKLSEECTKRVALSLIDILFAYLYDLRINDGEHSVESGWTIAKLCPSLCYLVRWTSAKEALTGAVRRSLCYPLYRHWDLAMCVASDLKSLLPKGRSAILHCLVDIRSVFSTSGDFRYLLNDLYMTDYCIWIQSADDQLVEWLREELEQVELQKNDVQLELEETELEAKLMALDVADKKEQIDSDDED